MRIFPLIIFAVVGPPVGAVALIVGFSVFAMAPQGLVAILFLLNPVILFFAYQSGVIPAFLTGVSLVLLERHALPVGYPLAGIVGFSTTWIVNAGIGSCKTWLPLGVCRFVSSPFLSNENVSSGDLAILASAGGAAAMVCLHLGKPLAPSAPAR